MRRRRLRPHHKGGWRRLCRQSSARRRRERRGWRPRRGGSEEVGVRAAVRSRVRRRSRVRQSLQLGGVRQMAQPRVVNSRREEVRLPGGAVEWRHTGRPQQRLQRRPVRQRRPLLLQLRRLRRRAGSVARSCRSSARRPGARARRWAQGMIARHLPRAPAHHTQLSQTSPSFCLADTRRRRKRRRRRRWRRRRWWRRRRRRPARARGHDGPKSLPAQTTGSKGAPPCARSAYARPASVRVG